ncbi:hypothetical protein ACFVUS_12485 [Nocardia sp. NPDC058058]|uniref:hypothetical protein n=1 Tax=Nocardia sp. NPDC058058 TaxID=3346317 RepID=UPI0036DA47AD
MSTFPTQHVYATSELLTAANLTNHANGISWLTSSRPLLLAHQASATTTLSNSTWTAITYDTTDSDSEGGFNAATGRYTFNQMGWYFLSGSVNYAGNATGVRAMRWRTNYATIIGLECSPAPTTPAGSPLNCSLNMGTLIGAISGDWVQMEGWHNSGGSLSTATNYAANHGEASFFSIVWVGGQTSSV